MQKRPYTFTYTDAFGDFARTAGEALEILEHSRDPDAPLIRALLTTAQQECENIFTETDI